MIRDIARTENVVIYEKIFTEEKNKYVVFLIDFGTKSFDNKHDAFRYAALEIPKIKASDYYRETHEYEF